MLSEYTLQTEIIAKHGYPVEEHFVTTSDRYILKMHRIPPTKPGSSNMIMGDRRHFHETDYFINTFYYSSSKITGTQIPLKME